MTYVNQKKPYNQGAATTTEGTDNKPQATLSLGVTEGGIDRITGLFESVASNGNKMFRVKLDAAAIERVKKAKEGDALMVFING